MKQGIIIIKVFCYYLFTFWSEIYVFASTYLNK
jgi:hypothetical protein